MTKNFDEKATVPGQIELNPSNEGRKPILTLKRTPVREATRRFVVTCAIVLGLTHVVFALGHDSLTNDDVVKMAQAQLAPNIIITTIRSAATVEFDVSPEGLIALKNAGVSDALLGAMIDKARLTVDEIPRVATRDRPEKSELLATSKDAGYILRNFKTMWVDASAAEFFDSQLMKGALGRNKDFGALNILIVDDRAVADVVLEVDYTFAWDYPFTLKHQNSSVILASGKGSGPFSGPAGAKSVAAEVAKALKPYRLPSALAKGK